MTTFVISQVEEPKDAEDEIDTEIALVNALWQGLQLVDSVARLRVLNYLRDRSVAEDLEDDSEDLD